KRGIDDDEDRDRVAESEPENEHRHPRKRWNRHQRAGEWKTEILHRPETPHQDSERQRDSDRDREPKKHAIHREAGMFQHRAVEEKRPERAGDLRQGWQQRRRKDAAARNRLDRKSTSPNSR